MATSLILNSTSLSGQKIQKTITDINGSAESDKLKTWAQGLNALTTNTQVGITKVVTTDLLNDSTSSKLPRNAFLARGGALTTPITTLSAAGIDSLDSFDYSNTSYVRIRCDGENDLLTGQVSLVISHASSSCDITVMPQKGDNSPVDLYFGHDTASVANMKGTVITVTLLETDTYAPQTLTLEITE